VFDPGRLSSRVHDVENVLLDGVGHAYCRHRLARITQLVGIDDGVDRRRAEFRVGVEPVEYFGLLSSVGEADVQFEHEAVALSLREFEGALHFEGVLGRDDEERVRQFVGFAFDSDVPFLHRLQERALGLRCRAVYLVSDDDVREHRPLLDDELTALLAVDGSPGDIRRKRVRGQLDAGVLQASRAGEQARDGRLRDTRDAFDQYVSASQKSHRQLFDDILVPDQDAADFVLYRVVYRRWPTH